MYFRTYTNSYKALLVCIISFFLTFTPSLVFATTVSSEGWSVSKRLVQGATTFYDGTKNVVLNGKNYVAKGTAAITPAASQVSKMIVRTGAVLAVDLAIKTLIGAVDYVMDPANNRVIYYPTTLSFSCTASSITRTASSLQLAAQSTCQAFTANVTYQGVTKISDSQYKCLYKNAGGDQSYTMNCSSVSVENHDKPEYLPYDAVASQIISDAASENSEAKAYVSSVADTSLDLDEQKQIVPATDVINQLNNSQAIPTSNAAQGQAVPQANPDDPTAPKAPPTDITINFPVFCDWAPLVCQAAQAAINFPATVGGWWNTLSGYLKGYDTWLNAFGKDDVNYPELDEYKIQEPDLDISVHQYFDSSAFCPEDRHIPLSMAGQSLDIIISYSALCTVAQQFRPAVILMSFLAGAFIITNTGRRAETGD